MRLLLFRQEYEDMSTHTLLFYFSRADEADKYIALVSGLGIGGNDFKPLELDLLAEYLTGEIGGVKVQLADDAEQINRLR